MESIDIGCGPKKIEGCFGLDIYPYPEVDLVHDLNQAPWPIDTNAYSKVYSRHVIEHVMDIVAYLKEIHRISKPDAEVYIETPHFSSVNSWTDPTHLRHLSAFWFEPFLQGQYLADQVGGFELIKTEVTFGKSLRARMGSWWSSVRGLKKWEKNLAFIYPGMDIKTWLRVKK